MNLDGLYAMLVIRMAKTTSSADAYFRLNYLLGSSELLVMPLASTSGPTAPPQPKTLPPTPSKGAAPANKDAPLASSSIYLNFYVANGDMHMTLAETYAFGMFIKADVKPGRPWISIHAVVSERTNFSNEQSVRHLNVKLPDLY